MVILNRVLADAAISISELKKNPSSVIDAAEGSTIAVLNRNKPAAYLVPAKAWEALMERLDDLELAALARARAHEKPARVKLDEL
jgi:antitoxin StbD